MRAYVVHRNRPGVPGPEFLKADVLRDRTRTYREGIQADMAKGTSNLFTTDPTQAFLFATFEAADAASWVIRALTNADCSLSGVVETHIGGTSIIRVV